MKYNLANNDELDQAAEYLSTLAGRDAEVEIKRIYPQRSLAQNNYLHLLLTAFGMHFGYSLEEAKDLYKRLNGAIYKYQSKGHTFMRSSADLDKDEMSATIQKLKEESARNGCELPDADQHQWLKEIGNDAERQGYYRR